MTRALNAEPPKIELANPKKAAPKLNPPPPPPPPLVGVGTLFGLEVPPLGFKI